MTMDPQEDADALVRAATQALAQGPNEAMLARLEVALRRHPRHAALATRRADALNLLRRTGEAVAAYRQALDLDATQFEAWYGLGGAELGRGAFATARDALLRAMALQPVAHGARCALAEALFGVGEVDAAAAQYRIAIAEGAPEVRDAALMSLAVLVPGSPAADHETVLQARTAWASRAAAAITPLPHRPPPQGRPVRLAYLSAFFGARNWMKPVFGVINRHDRARFELHLISDGDDPAAASGYAEHADDWIWQVRGMPNGALARTIAEAGIDVLVDLNGYSLPNRLGLFPHRPARLQLGWFNMFATTGVPGMDLLVGDAASVLPEEERFHSERIRRVPGSYLAFQVPYPTPPVAPSPWRANGFPTLGCLGSAYKLTPGTLDAWAAILRKVPQARLHVANPTLDEASNRADLLARLAARGVAEARVTTAGRAEHFDFLRGYDRVDIALDTFPYNGGTTTTEALWQGVPVLTCIGDRWAGRTSRSLLLAAGLGEWVAPGIPGFVADGVGLLRDPATPAMLAALRTSMRARLAASPACNSAGLCAALEAIYTEGLPGAMV